MISGYDCFVIEDGMSDAKIARGLQKAQAYIDDRNHPKKTPDQIEIEFKISERAKAKETETDDNDTVVITKVSF
ncbi:MAG: hypothetical protein MJZ20_02855 [Bacteroidaceae bacterium]|nr:hypothetical protein [Bacteroidaceae bacterium]